MLTTVTVSNGGRVAPALSAYLIIFVVAGLAAAVAAGTTALIPARKVGLVIDPGRTAILRAARRAFALQPYAAVTLRGIAGDANVSAALIVKHFGSKEALFDGSPTSVKPPSCCWPRRTPSSALTPSALWSRIAVTAGWICSSGSSSRPAAATSAR